MFIVMLMTASIIPILEAALEFTKDSSKSILELGVGNTTTPFLNSQKRKVLSVEHNSFWASKMMPIINKSTHHTLITLDESTPNHWEKFIEIFPANGFDVVLIDQSPWSARHFALTKFKDSIPIVILPDCDYYPKNNMFGQIVKSGDVNIESVFAFDDIFKYYKVFYPPAPWPLSTGPPVLVGSNLMELENFLLITTTSLPPNANTYKFVEIYS